MQYNWSHSLLASYDGSINKKAAAPGCRYIHKLLGDIMFTKRCEALRGICYLILRKRVSSTVAEIRGYTLKYDLQRNKILERITRCFRQSFKNYIWYYLVKLLKLLHLSMMSFRDLLCLWTSSTSRLFSINLALRVANFFCHFLLSSHRITSSEECWGQTSSAAGHTS